MNFSGFDWDSGNRVKCQKHGVSLGEIEDVFRLGPGLWPDVTNSISEPRMRAIGKISSGRWIFVAFTFRHREGLTFVRPISARYMHSKEIAHYEKAQAASRIDER